MKRILIFAYGIISYVVAMASLVYLAGWLADIVVPVSIEGEQILPTAQALAIDFGLLSIFVVQHTIMARPAFKRRWTRIIPKAAERSTFVLVTGLIFIFLFVYWQPISGTVWSVESPTLRGLIWGLYGLGWAILVGSTFLLNHFDLFGVRHVWLELRGQPYTPLEFDTPMIYRYVRHPLYLGMVILLWSAPTMSLIRLIFAIGATGYILVGVRFEEKDLLDVHPEYASYRERVPMLIPRLKRAANRDGDEVAGD